MCSIDLLLADATGPLSILMPEELSLSLTKFFFDLKKKKSDEGLRPGLNLKAVLTYFHHSTTKACFVILPSKHACMGVT